jgi:hypothetical protein
MRHITKNGVAFVVGATKGTKVNPPSNFGFEASGKGYVTIMVPNDHLAAVVELGASSGITSVKIDENTLTIFRGKIEETHVIVVGDKRSYKLLPTYAG